jgi:hypothetical protein
MCVARARAEEREGTGLCEWGIGCLARLGAESGACCALQGGGDSDAATATATMRHDETGRRGRNQR